MGEKLSVKFDKDCRPDTRTAAERAADYIWDHWNSLFHGELVQVDREHPVYGTMGVDSSDSRTYWSIDYVADFRGKRYLIECDVNKSARDIWHGFKIFGYRAAYCIDRGLPAITKLGVMMFFHERNFSHRVRNTLAYAGVEFCTFREDGLGGWDLTRCSLWRGDGVRTRPKNSGALR